MTKTKMNPTKRFDNETIRVVFIVPSAGITRIRFNGCDLRLYASE
jgi:hypothetical protein